MQEYETEIRLGNACPVCQSQLEDGDLFCARCGSFLRGENSSPEALNMPVVHLLTQVCTLQKDMMRQFRSGQALQARQSQRALELQAQLEKTLANSTTMMESQERRLQMLVRWTAGLAAAAVGLIFIGVQVL
ncbi:MAG TPA: hypothetical protein VLS25_03210 [Dehalococcoidia bacterium]|nr:hypothetical protein [Dehalococcoidia bacterium]